MSEWKVTVGHVLFLGVHIVNSNKPCVHALCIEMHTKPFTKLRLRKLPIKLPPTLCVLSTTSTVVKF